MNVSIATLDGVLLAASIAVLYRFERPPPPKKFRKHRRPKPQVSLSILFLLFAAALALIGMPSRSLLLSLYIILIVGLVSSEKAKHTPFNLVVDDILVLRDGAAEFLAVGYRSLAAKALMIFALLTALLIAGFIWLPSDHVPWLSRFIPLIAALATTYAVFHAFDWRDWFGVFAFTRNYCHISGFFVSAFLVHKPDPILRLSNVADEGVSLSPQTENPGARQPDIILIHHESTFDPETYGIKIGKKARRFISPSNAISGRLRVDTFGGNSWMTEFSLQTGISSRAFGASGQYIFHRAVGRVKHAIPLFLKRRGYKTKLLATVSQRFLGYNAFYESIGVEDRIFMADLGPPFDNPDLRKHHSDEEFYARASDHLEQSISHDSRPEWILLLTNFNHGPHTERKMRKRLSKKDRAFALQQFPDEEYAEYYARMVFSAGAYAKFRADLVRKFPDRPILVIRYGDHQPKFVKNILKANKIDDTDPRVFETFYSVEAINFTLEIPARPLPDPLDVAFLATVAMRAAKMDLPPIFAAHEAMIDECGSNYHDTPSEMKARFHRTLLRDGFIEAEPQ